MRSKQLVAGNRHERKHVLLGMITLVSCIAVTAPRWCGAFVLGTTRKTSFGASSINTRAAHSARNAQHSQVAQAQMSQMPTAPEDPLEWSLEEVGSASFMASAAYAGSLCRAFENGKDDEAHAARLEAMLQHSDGARGFFVTYLTDPALKLIADDPQGPPPLIASALRNSDADTVVPLAVMNLLMPTATRLMHKENGDKDMEANSARTAQRGAQVLKVLLADTNVGPVARTKLKAAKAAAHDEDKEGAKEWKSFYARWKYNPLQMKSIQEALDDILLTTAQ